MNFLIDEGKAFYVHTLFLLWVIFNGKVTLEIVLFGIVIAGAVYAFCCKFLDYSPPEGLAYHA